MTEVEEAVTDLWACASPFQALVFKIENGGWGYRLGLAGHGRIDGFKSEKEARTASERHLEQLRNGDPRLIGQPRWAESLERCRPSDLPDERLPSLEQAARSLLSAVQAYLEPLEDRRILGPMRGVIYVVQHRALEALRWQLPPAFVNRVRRECGLLTVCYGSVERQAFERWSLRGASYRFHNGDGCGLVYRGSDKQLSQCRCSTCQERKTRSRKSFEASVEARYLLGKFRIPASSFTIDGRQIDRLERWRGRCVNCGEPFENTRVDASRCGRCR